MFEQVTLVVRPERNIRFEKGLRSPCPSSGVLGRPPAAVQPIAATVFNARATTRRVSGTLNALNARGTAPFVAASPAAANSSGDGFWPTSSLSASEARHGFVATPPRPIRA